MLRRVFTVTYNLLVPYLLSVVQLDFGSLLDKLGVALHKLNAPLRVLLQVIKLILERRRKGREGMVKDKYIKVIK